MLYNLDVKLFYLINKGCANSLFDIAMPVISELGNPEVIAGIAILILLLAKGRNRKCAILLFAGLLAGYLAVYLLKNWIARPRPFVVLPDVHLLEAGKKGFSFPSSHATQSFMAATVLSRFFKKYALFFIIALLVCFSRVYMGVHFISDVIGGAIIGTIIARALLYI